MFPDALVDRFQRLKACPGPGSMDADHITDEVAGGHEHRGYALQPGVNLGGIGAPHPVRAIGDDGPVVDLGAPLSASSVRGLQAVFAHQAPHQLLRDGDAPALGLGRPH